MKEGEDEKDDNKRAASKRAHWKREPNWKSGKETNTIREELLNAWNKNSDEQ